MEAPRKFNIKVMEGCANLVCQATPNFFDSILFSGQLQWSNPGNFEQK
jgi:hypothetical protein